MSDVLVGGTRPSNSRASQRRRDAIAQATLTLLRDRPTDAVAVADIAAVAEVSVATVYNLVGPRDRLLAGVLDSYVATLAAALDNEAGPAGAVEAAVHVVAIAATESVADPVPIKAVLRELGPLHLDESKGAGMADLLLPRLIAAGAGPVAADEAARLIVYAFRGVLLSWAHDLITDDEFRTDAELVTRRLATAIFIDPSQETQP